MVFIPSIVLIVTLYKLVVKTAQLVYHGGGTNIVASQNIPWDVLTPQVQSQLEPKTGMVARVQGTSGTSCSPFPSGSSAETSFVKDSDFQDVTIGEENYFPATKIVANEINEINRMNSVKSLLLS